MMLVRCGPGIMMAVLAGGRLARNRAVYGANEDIVCSGLTAISSSSFATII